MKIKHFSILIAALFLCQACSQVSNSGAMVLDNAGSVLRSAGRPISKTSNNLWIAPGSKNAAPGAAKTNAAKEQEDDNPRRRY